MLDGLSRYDFGPFQLDPPNRLLTRNHQPVQLAPRVFDTLVTLVRFRGRVVTKDELFQAVWAGSFVEESNLTVAISALRKALDDGDGRQKYIQTVPKFGYRFVCEVTVIDAVPAEAARAPDLPFEETDPAVAWRLPPRIVLAASAAVLACLSIAVWKLPRTWRFDPPVNVAALFVPWNLVIAHGVLQPPRTHSLSSTPSSPQSCGAEAAHSSEVQALYLKGRYSSSRGTEKGLEHGVAYFRNAIAQDPCNAPAFAGLADTYLSLPGWSIQAPSVAYRKAQEAAERAAFLDNSLPQVHATLGMLALVRDWNFAVAEREFRRGIELGPNEPLAHQGMGMFLATRGRLEDALKEMQRARDLDPLSLDIGMKLGLMRYYLRQYAQAIVEYKKVIDLDPHYSVAHYMLGVTYFVQSDYANAARELRESSGLVNDREPLAYGLYAAARARIGDEATARSVQTDVKERLRNEYISPTSMAVFYLGLGQMDRALDWVDQMFRDRLLDALLVSVDPLYDPIRSDRRVLALLESLNGKSQLPATRDSAWASAPPISGN